MKKFLGLFIVFSTFLVSCQFSETMVINEDGSGRMTVSLDMREMMAFAGEMGGQDSTMVKMDTLIRFKDFLEEKKDSIAALPMAEQKKLKRMEPFTLKMVMDQEEGEMVFDLFTDFKNVAEANDMMNGFSQTTGMMGNVGGDMSVNKDADTEDIMGVNYAFSNGVFTRDAYIKDPERHAQQIDSIKQAEMFMESMKYKLKYTFPKRIVKSSIEDARFSMDGKTIEVEASFIEYFKNPDVLDLEVELENK